MYDDLLVSLILDREEENQIVQQEIQVIQLQQYVVEDHIEHLRNYLYQLMERDEQRLFFPIKKNRIK
jgi:hypothetical protein